MGSLASVYLHIVFSTKNREPILTNDIKDDIIELFHTVSSSHGCIVLACNGMPDHIHLLIKTNMQKSISDIVKEIKRISSLRINTKYKDRSFYWQHHFAAFSVSHSLVPKVIDYIKNQETHHQSTSVTYLCELEDFAKYANEPIDKDFYE